MNELPTITHEGRLELLGVNVRVYRLSNGQAIFNADDTHEVLRRMMGDVTADELPADLKAQIQSLLDTSLVEFQSGGAS